MARVKNVTDEALVVPSLGLVVQPGETVEVADASGFKGSPSWQVTTSKKADTEENA